MTESSRGCVLFATMEFYPTTPGGAGILIHHTVCLLLEQGFTVVLLFDGGRGEFERLVGVDRHNIPSAHRLLIYRVDDLCEDLVGAPEECPEIAVSKSIRLDHALRKLTQMHAVELIELYDYCGHGFHYLSWPIEDRPPVAIRLHSTIELMECKTGMPLLPERLWLYAMERAQLALADVILAPGAAYYEQDIRPRYPAITPDRVLISPPVHRPIGEIEYDPDARNVAFYGRLSTLKGLDTFLRAGVLALEDPVFAGWLEQFIVIGPDENVATALSASELRALIPNAKAELFRFTGRLDHAALMPQLQNVAFACFANRVEAFCYAAHELHTAGIPLIVNRIAAFEDGFDEGIGAVFFDGTAFDLAGGMKRLARDAALRQRLSQYGKQRAASYWQNHYPGHLSRLRERRVTRAEGVPLRGSAIVVSTGDRAAVDRTLASLLSLPLRPIVLDLDMAGPLASARGRWRGTGREDVAGPLGLQPVGEACLFLRAGDVVEPQWAVEALRVLAQEPRIGAVGGWLRTHTAIVTMPYVYVPELAGLDEPGLRVLLRVGRGQTVAEYLEGWSGQFERSQLLAHRRQGRVCVELPRLAVDTSGAVDLPRNRDTAITVDVDRGSREFPTLAHSFGTDGIAMLAIAPPVTSGIAAMLRDRPDCCVLTPEAVGLAAGRDPGQEIADAMQAIGEAACRKLAIDTGLPGAAEFADRLLQADTDISVIGLLGEQTPLGFGGTLAAYRALGPWLRLATRFPARFSAASTSQALTGLFSRCGARTFTVPIRLPALGKTAAAAEDEIDVIVIAGTGAVSSTAHMIMAVAQARRSGLPISRLWLPAEDIQADVMAQGFAAAPIVERYENLADPFHGDSRRRVALQVFPDDDELPAAAAVAVAAGALPILGPACAFAGCAPFRDLLCIALWEDAVAIADGLTGTTECFDRLAVDYDQFRRDRDDMAAAGLAALLAGSSALMVDGR